MLSEILSKEYCSKCRFCCVFEVRHLWEMPEKIAGIAKDYEGADPMTEVPCPYLDENTGCTLTGCEKPFECAIWPFRIMMRDGVNVLAVADTCPGMKKYTTEELREFALKKLREPARDYCLSHPNAAKPLVDYYTELFELR